MASNSYKRPMQFADLDQIVATYAPIGAQRRRQRSKRRALLGGALVATCASLVLLAQSDIQIRDRLSGSSGGVTAGMSSDELAQLKLERAAFNQKFEELARQLDLVQVQKAQLEARQTELANESSRVAALLDATDTNETDPGDDERAQGLKLEEEIAAMAAQRQALGERWQQFEAQGELLAMEIIAVNAQRKELEKQRGLIERQRQELSKLLEQAEQLYRRNISAAETTLPNDETTSLSVDEEEQEVELVATAGSMMVQNAELDTMRGGFTVGEGLDISFGFQQSGSVNGVEQFRNSFSIDNIGSGSDFSNVDMSNMKSVVLQSGTGNFVGANVFDSLTDSFGNVIQNTLDDQVISTTTIYDISLQNVPGTLQGLAGEQALHDSLTSF